MSKDPSADAEPVSADDLQDYIEGRSAESDRSKVERYLKENPGEAARLEALRRQAERLKRVGEKILHEPVPQQFMDILQRLPKAPSI